MTREQPNGGGTELGRFLRARRAGITPAEAGLTVGSGPRRTPGLRREELATLAGISIDYYTRLERGRETRPSPSVVDSLGRALHLDEDEHEYLRSLAALAARTAPEPPTAPSRTVRPGVKLLLESLRPNPAHVVSRTHDLLAANPGGLRLLAGIEEWPARQRNIARYVFLHPAARNLFHDWATQVRGCVARLRALAGTDPDAPDLTRLAGELLLRSPEFARLWERYDVKGHSHGRKTFHHPEVGDLTLGYQSMELEGTPGHRLVTYHAQPGSAEYDALVLLDLLGAQATPRGPSADQEEARSSSPRSSGQG
ncbi:helix-turn-helix transcriptional regulator [Streptomyces canus]|uniref:helix-turn-helix transcriptional regulator n=1 Tax=Streptomyces canus TaxID=58343 RepID=UPI002DDA46EA|nr:helix-turn-helix transcriptional regulator [Streptomyces canus]WSD91532.1 helix-turn-helix transcriptional regulator [Streptomyces canus]